MENDLIIDDIVGMARYLEDLEGDPKALLIFTIYFNASDYPNEYVARAFRIVNGVTYGCIFLQKFESLEAGKKYFERHNLHFLNFHIGDDKSIVGSYF
jgi:hypothetical protein